MTEYLQQEIEKVLTAMAYRRMSHETKVVWGKPTGWQLFTLEIRDDKLRWTNWFIGANKQILVWESLEWLVENGAEFHGSVMSWLKDAECYSGKMVHSGQRTNFEFMTREESIHSALEATLSPPSYESFWGPTDLAGNASKKSPDPIQAGLER